MVGASPCALDVAPLAYATAINHCARKECFEAGRTEKIHGGSKDFNIDLNFAPFGCKPRLTIAPSNGPCCKCHVLYVMGYGAAATVGIVLAQRATATAIHVACVLTAKIFPGACLILYMQGKQNVALPLITSIFLAFLFIYFEFPSPLVNSVNLFDSHL
ncbi:hypothetical protein OIU85_017874 [Salix viminalis]|uniref:Uncharacterized protein n=1 Tax=Salix viminalis TaxID=40686 RepID=A0A9Q0UT26_SALVM|nr:hypothetical protein OIU85_017874 [Salix viminalis]